MINLLNPPKTLHPRTPKQTTCSQVIPQAKIHFRIAYMGITNLIQINVNNKGLDLIKLENNNIALNQQTSSSLKNK